MTISTNGEGLIFQLRGFQNKLTFYEGNDTSLHKYLIEPITDKINDLEIQLESFYNNENEVVVTPKEIEEDEERRKGREKQNTPGTEPEPKAQMYFHEFSPKARENFKL